MKHKWYVLWGLTLLIFAGVYLNGPGLLDYIVGITLVLIFFAMIAST